ncbi:maleylpyruvate isomerase family mycothiol-dependent enzyme [Actinomadura barringtoniae]|uniref:Maleylpyruvate isomerase family mycothiol-dependent enzyme n=1 Tax=Actinomadura barringtoniae TaxID=1427535 RepID=A0A939PB55_9ACTN|nr:maleylpyruvate isomerase family mycothiol-dependent enzyme [Actinomadura barringtoniae]MBO2446793.1 maleylpyruvate isomerase family mycothiol-dependent enzyme [Actinomadura barringtoniae]
MERSELVQRVDEVTERLVAAVGNLSDADVREDSQLPGWTRGHVITHVARNADALRNLLNWARTGIETPAYESAEAREAGIAEGADRSVIGLLADLSGSAAAFAAAVEVMPEETWDVKVKILDSAEFPAEGVLLKRASEVVLHHTDLGIGYGPDDWPDWFAKVELDEPIATFRKDRLA